MKLLVHNLNGQKYIVPADQVVLLPSCAQARGCISVAGLMIITQETQEQLVEMLSRAGPILEARDIAVSLLDCATAEQKLLNWGPEIVNAVLHCKRSDMLLPPCGPAIVMVDGKTKLRRDLSEETIGWLSEIVDMTPTAEIARMVEIHKNYVELTKEGGEL